MQMDRVRRHLIALAFAVLLAIIVGRGYIFQPGYIYLAEQFEAFSVDAAFEAVYPPWDEQLQLFHPEAGTKLFLYLGPYLLGKLFSSYKLYQALLLLLPVAVAFFSTYLLLDNLLTEYPRYRPSAAISFVAALLGGYCYILNPWFATNPRNLALRFDYALLPLILFLFLRILRGGRARHIIGLSVVLTLAAGYRNIAILAVMLGGVTLLWMALTHRTWHRAIFPIFRRLAIVGILFGILSSVLFLPALFHAGYDTPTAVTDFTEAIVNRMTPADIFTLKPDKPGFDLTYSGETSLLMMLLVVFSFTYLFYKTPSSTGAVFSKLLPLSLFVLFFLLVGNIASISTPSTGLLDSIGRLFRHARWNMMPMVLSVCVMLSYSAREVLSRSRRIGTVVLIVIAILAGISAWPVLTGDMNGYWAPTPVPTDYTLVNNLLKEDATDSHTLWLPSTIRRAIWSKQLGAKDTSAPAGLLAVRGASVPSYHMNSFYFFDYFNALNYGPGMGQLPLYQSDLSVPMSLLNVSNLVFHSDGYWAAHERAKGFNNELIRDTAMSLTESNTFTEIYRGQWLSVFSNPTPGDELTIKPIILSYGGLTSLEPFMEFTDITLPGMVFASGDRVDYLDAVPGALVLANDVLDFLPTFEDAQLIATRRYAKAASLSEGWSPGDVSQPLFQEEMFNQGVDWSWEFDYGEGLAITAANDAVLQIPLSIRVSGQYKVFLRLLMSTAGGTILARIGGTMVEIPTSSLSTSFRWIVAWSGYLDKGSHILSLVNVEGFNAVNLVVPLEVASYESFVSETRERLSARPFALPVKTTFDPTYGEAESIPYNNTVIRQATIETPVEGLYSVAILGQGMLRATIDDAEYTLDCDSSALCTTETFFLEQGTHILSIQAEETGEEVEPESRPLWARAVYLCSSNGRETLERLLSDPIDAAITSVRRTGSSSRELTVVTNEPFLLAFAEGFDHLWVAEVSTPGRSSRFNSLPLYDTINGFWIDAQGELFIRLRFIPQRWFWYSAVGSGAGFAGIFVYLVWQLAARGKRKRTEFLDTHRDKSGRSLDERQDLQV